MLQLEVHSATSSPFAYFEGEGAFADVVMSSLICWLKDDAPWKLVEADFYEQYEFDLRAVSLPPALNSLTSPSSLYHLRQSVEEQFRTTLHETVDVAVHKLVEGQRIRVHNDYLEKGETHRLILQLNEKWSPECGGYLMLFNSDDPRDVHKVIAPALTSLFGFAIGPLSYHAVSTVKQGERLTLVYSFYEKR